MITRTTRAVGAAIGLTALTLAAVVPGADGAEDGSVTGSVEVRPDIRSLTVSPTAVSLNSCVSENTTVLSLFLPNGFCRSRFHVISVTNTGAAGNVVVSTSDVRGGQGDTAWQACEAVAQPCHGTSGKPGADQARVRLFNEFNGNYEIGRTPANDKTFGSFASPPNATRGEAHRYNVELTAPTTSTSNPARRQFDLTWTVTP